MLTLYMFMYVVHQYVLLFGRPSVLTVFNKRKDKFLTDCLKSCNSLCRLFGHAALNELKGLQSCAKAEPNVGVFLLLVKFFLLLCFSYILSCATI